MVMHAGKQCAFLFSFRGVSAIMNFEGSEYGSNHTVWYLTIEEEYAFLEEYMERYKIEKDDVLYLCFGMFSGGEMHILAKEVFYESGPEQWEACIL